MLTHRSWMCCLREFEDELKYVELSGDSATAILAQGVQVVPIILFAGISRNWLRPSMFPLAVEERLFFSRRLARSFREPFACERLETLTARLWFRCPRQRRYPT